MDRVSLVSYSPKRSQRVGHDRVTKHNKDYPS